MSTVQKRFHKSQKERSEAVLVNFRNRCCLVFFNGQEQETLGDRRRSVKSIITVDDVTMNYVEYLSDTDREREREKNRCVANRTNSNIFKGEKENFQNDLNSTRSLKESYMKIRS